MATLWISTDVDDFATVLAEAGRVLGPGGLLAFYGAHPVLQRAARLPGPADAPDA